MISLCFAFDKLNYAKLLSFYLSQALELKNINKEVFQHFQNGGFSVQLKKGNPFSKIEKLQKIEAKIRHLNLS